MIASAITSLFLGRLIVAEIEVFHRDFPNPAWPDNETVLPKSRTAAANQYADRRAQRAAHARYVPYTDIRESEQRTLHPGLPIAAGDRSIRANDAIAPTRKAPLHLREWRKKRARFWPRLTSGTAREAGLHHQHQCVPPEMGAPF